MNALVEVKDICKIYNPGENEVRALDHVNLYIEKGEFVAIIGQSGSGKSTLMNMLGCLDVPTSGQYYLNGKDVSTLSDNELSDIRNVEIGFIFQGFNLIGNLTAKENVELPLIYRGVGKKEREKLALEALEMVGLSHRIHHRPNEMSGGQQQRVAIARAIAAKPPVILADEPTGNLDSASSEEILQILKELHKGGRTVILITHDKENNEKVSTTEIVETKKKRERIPLTKEQKKKRRNKILIGTVAIVVVAAVVLPKVFAPEVLPTVNVVQVATGDVVQMIEGSGTVKSEEVKTYFSPVSATVENCQLKVGDLVETGDLLLTFDEKELDQLYKQAGLTGSVANYGYQDAINKNQETESEYQRSSQALKEIRKDLEAEKDENEHVQDRIVEYTGKQSDVALRISQYRAVAADALLKIEDATREKQEALALKT